MLENVNAADLLAELERRAPSGEARADLQLLREQFAAPPTQQPRVTPDSPPVAPLAPSAGAAGLASASSTAPAAGSPQQATQAYLRIDTNIVGDKAEIAEMVRRLILRFARGELSPVASQLVQLAAEVQLMEERLGYA